MTKPELTADRLEFYLDGDKRTKYADKESMEAAAPTLEEALEAGTRYVA